MKKHIPTLCLSAMLALSGCVVNPESTTSSESANGTPRPEPAKAVELYQLAPNSQGLMQSYVIKTKKNKLIVIDGGIDGVGTNDDPYLPAALRSILCLEEGEYFIADLAGLPVFDAESGREYGKVKEVINRGASDIYVVETPSGETMIPAVPAFVDRVEITKGLFVNPIEGMFASEDI